MLIFFKVIIKSLSHEHAKYHYRFKDNFAQII